MPGYEELHSIAIVSPPAVTAEELLEWARLIGEEQMPPTPETMLADARFLANWRQPPDAQRAVLMAAIACEVKVQRRLLELAKPDALPLLDLMLDNPRAFPHAALELFNKVPAAVGVHTLRDEDIELFKSVARLYEVRNAVAHRGETPDAEEVANLVIAATRVFSWLDGLTLPT
jgi:hypothetical protein